MNINFIEQLADLLNEKQLSAVEVCEGASKVRLERSGGAFEGYEPQVKKAVSPPPVESAPEKQSEQIQTVGVEIKSPMVGVFYAAPSPDAKPFLSVGDRVKKGDIVCIIEAMKLMNEITSEADGEIASVCVENGAVVEYGQTLFVVR